jgi:hypothetical protein
MNYLHYNLDLAPGEVVEVTLDKQANIRLLDETNFERYKRGAQHTYHGGFAKRSPVRISPPRPGHWHLVIDLGGYAGSVKAAVQTMRAA